MSGKKRGKRLHCATNIKPKHNSHYARTRIKAAYETNRLNRDKLNGLTK